MWCNVIIIILYYIILKPTLHCITLHNALHYILLHYISFVAGAVHLFRYVTNQPPKANSAVHPSGVGKWVPVSAGKAKAGMVHSVSGWTRGVQVKLWDPLRTCAISERLRGVFTTRRYTNTRLPLPLPLPFVLWSSLFTKNVEKHT